MNNKKIVEAWHKIFEGECVHEWALDTDLCIKGCNTHASYTDKNIIPAYDEDPTVFKMCVVELIKLGWIIKTNDNGATVICWRFDGANILSSNHDPQIATMVAMLKLEGWKENDS